MASGRRPPGDRGPRQRRPPPTIDLTGTEIASEPVAPAAARVELPSAQAPVQSQEAPLPERSAEPPMQPPRLTRQAEPPPVEPPPPPQPEAEPRPHPYPPPLAGEGKAGRLIAAGAAGGALALLLFGGLWLTGALTPRDDEASALKARLALIELQQRDLAARPAPAPVDPKAVEDVAARLGKLESALADRLAAVENAAKAYGETLAGQERRIASANALAESARSQAVEKSDVDAMAGRVAALERAFKAAADDRRGAAHDKAVRLVVGAAALRGVVERGEPFATELAAVKPLAADPGALAALEPFAATGVPAAAVLARELSELVPSLQRAAAGAPPDATFLDRLQTNAGRLVRVRPIEEVPGDDPAAIIARVEAKAGQGELAGALAELARLPASVRALAEAWKTRAEARVAAIEASRRFAADALAALGRPSP